MAPQTRSSALKDAATNPKVGDSHQDIEPRVSKKPEISNTKANPWCMSDKQIERICDRFGPVGRANSHLDNIYNHCVKQPALLPVEMEYLVKALVPTASGNCDMEGLVNYGGIDWDTVARSFNDRFSAAAGRRKVKVLKCAMRADYHKVQIAVFRERCRLAHEGVDNAGIHRSLTAAELEHRLIDGRGART